MKHIISFSGGKDSTAMVDEMIKRKMPIDEIINIDTGAEYPEMYDHIKTYAKNSGIKFTTLHFKYSFEFYMLDYVKVKGKSKGSKGYGWCGGLCRWGTTMKKQIFAKYIKEKYNNEIIEYQGIAYDEHERINKNTDKKWEVRYPLNEWKWVEKDALNYCYSLGYTWGGLYEQLDRVSCWCCRNKNLKELKNIFYNLPMIWLRMKNLEYEIGEPYYKSKTTLSQLETRFKKEGLQLKIF